MRPSDRQTHIERTNREGYISIAIELVDDEVDDARICH